MRQLNLDLSSKTGWSVFDFSGTEPEILVGYGRTELGRPILEWGVYPDCYLLASKALASDIWAAVAQYAPFDRVVIEETNGSKARYTQKWLEFLHLEVLRMLESQGHLAKVKYLSTSTWRSAINLRLSAQDKAANKALSKAKARARETGTPLDKKKLKVKGKKTPKHLAVEWANAQYTLTLKQKDNDIADSLALGKAALLVDESEFCDGGKKND